MGAVSVFGQIAYIDSKACTIVFVAVLFALVFFEGALHAFEKACEHYGYKGLVKKLYREFMIMGFISFGTFLVNEFYKYNSNDKWYNAFHFTHIVVLFIALTFVIQAALMVAMITNRKKTLLGFGLVSCAELLVQYDKILEAASSSNLKDRIRHFLFFHGPLLINYPRFRENVELKIIQGFFIRVYNLPPEFNFAIFYIESFRNYIISLVDVRPFQWFLLAALVVTNYMRVEFLDHFNQAKFCRREEYSAEGYHSGNHLMCDTYTLIYTFVCISMLTIFLFGVLIMSEIYMGRLIDKVLSQEEAIAIIEESPEEFKDVSLDVVLRSPKQAENFRDEVIRTRRASQEDASPAALMQKPEFAKRVELKAISESESESSAGNQWANSNHSSSEFSIGQVHDGDLESNREATNVTEPATQGASLTSDKLTFEALNEFRSMNPNEKTQETQRRRLSSVVSATGIAELVQNMFVRADESLGRRHLYLNCLQRIWNEELLRKNTQGARASMMSQGSGISHMGGLTGLASVMKSLQGKKGVTVSELSTIAKKYSKTIKSLKRKSVMEEKRKSTNSKRKSRYDAYFVEEEEKIRGRSYSTAVHMMAEGRTLYESCVSRCIEGAKTVGTYAYALMMNENLPSHGSPNARGRSGSTAPAMHSTGRNRAASAAPAMSRGRATSAAPMMDPLRQESIALAVDEETLATERDISTLFLWNRPQLFYHCIEFGALLQCLYIALWATNFAHIALSNRHAGPWFIAMTFPILINFYLLKCILYFATTLKCVSEPNMSIVDRLCENAVEEINVSIKLRKMVRKALTKHCDSKSVRRSYLQEEFIRLAAEDQEIEEDDAEDKNYMLDVEKFAELLHGIQIRLTDQSIARIFKVLDTDMDGLLTWNELSQIVFPENVNTRKKHRYRRKNSDDSTMTEASNNNNNEEKEKKTFMGTLSSYLNPFSYNKQQQEKGGSTQRNHRADGGESSDDHENSSDGGEHRNDDGEPIYDISELDNGQNNAQNSPDGSKSLDISNLYPGSDAPKSTTTRSISNRFASDNNGPIARPSSLTSRTSRNTQSFRDKQSISNLFITTNMQDKMDTNTNTNKSVHFDSYYDV